VYAKKYSNELFCALESRAKKAFKIEPCLLQEQFIIELDKIEKWNYRQLLSLLLSSASRMVTSNFRTTENRG